MQAAIATLTTQFSEANQELVDTLNVCTTLKEKIGSTKKNATIVEVEAMV